MEDKVKRLQAKLDADAKFVEELLNKETPEEVQALLKSEGIDFNMEEISQLKKAILNSLQGKDGELSEEALDGVAGGALIEINIDTVNITPSVLPGDPGLPTGTTGGGLPGVPKLPKW